MLKLKCSYLALTIFVLAGFILSGDAFSNPVCGTLDECRSLRNHLHEQLVDQDSKEVRKILVSHLNLVNARIEELLSQSTEPETRTTHTGAVFTRDRSHVALNEAWRDPKGLIWGDIVKNEDGSIRYMVQSSEYMKKIGRPLPDGQLGAEEYCKSIGARLPTQEEFTRLREYMGARSGTHEGYSHHDDKILPNLNGHWFWSSSVDPYVTGFAYDFNGTVGYVGFDYRDNYDDAVRCVVVR